VHAVCADVVLHVVNVACKDGLHAVRAQRGHDEVQVPLVDGVVQRHELPLGRERGERAVEPRHVRKHALRRRGQLARVGAAERRELHHAQLVAVAVGRAHVRGDAARRVDHDNA
jgi:hypothetical protein